MDHVYDIAILGATPAGYAAAYLLATKKLDVVLVDAPAAPSESPLSDWVPKDFFKLPALPKNLAQKAQAEDFRSVVYHNTTLTRQVQFDSRGAIGYVLEQPLLTAALKSAAAKAGAKIKPGRGRPAIRLEEERVCLTAPASVCGRVLMIAYNRPNEVIGDLALPVQNVPQPHMVVAGLNVPLPRAAATKLAGALHVVELRERSDLGMFFVSNHHLHLRVISTSAAAGTRAQELSSMLSGLQRSGILPAEMPLGNARGAVWRPPAGVALELETHVAKRCLLLGTAGGFAESITGQTLYPSVYSAILAAQVAQAALAGKKPQEDLMQFKSSWRKTLADYLRPPNTSLQMLLPLLFVNQQIVSKFTKALLFGENI